MRKKILFTVEAQRERRDARGKSLRTSAQSLPLYGEILIAFLLCGLSTHAQPNQPNATLTNAFATVTVNRSSGVWAAVWKDGTAIKSVQFSVEVNTAPIVGNPVESTLRAFSDSLGKGQELKQFWRNNGVQVERELRLYDSGVITLSGRIRNESNADARLGTAQLLQAVSWQLGSSTEIPAAVHARNTSQMSVLPFTVTDNAEQQDYTSSGVITFLTRKPRAALTVGYVRADDASPDLAAKFQRNAGGSELKATSRFLNRVLGARETVELNRLYLAAGDDPYQLLEAYGDAMVKVSPLPARTGPTALWCSWYAHRMEVSEDKVLANAEVAAKHFAPLGFEVMQIDHGWQRGDVTGDWTANESFPHGLKWLARELKQRYGLKLGLWISPTDVADTSEFYQQHSDWMLKGEDGQNKVNWKWFWKPNPNCYQLDTTRPEAFDHVADVFKQLVAEDVSYFKIDFIGSQGKESFVPYDPKYTRGWSVFRRAMQAVRAGAGEAWVRYCQAPPLMSVGVADGAYGGDDTADAGQPGMFRVLRDNAKILATSYWLNDRIYHREVCDMSMRMHATVEEARVRAAMMTLANTSISWSDELTYLPPSRIRMMQQCMPAGNPAMRPVDLFDRDIPSVWHIKAKNDADSWDVVGLFNFNDKVEARSVRFDQLGLDPNAQYAVFEFWEEKFIGLLKTGVELNLPPESSRILSIRRVTGKPQLIGTDMHVLQGYHELKRLQWSDVQLALSGHYHRMPGLKTKAFFLVPNGFAPRFEFPLSPRSARLTHVEGNVWMQEIEFQTSDFTWTIPFEKVALPQVKEPN
jgi:Melibiase